MRIVFPYRHFGFYLRELVKDYLKQNSGEIEQDKPLKVHYNFDNSIRFYVRYFALFEYHDLLEDINRVKEVFRML